MNFKIISNNEYKIFVNNFYFEKINFDSEKDIEIFLKKVLVTIKNKYNINLCGFYEVVLHNNYKIGTFLYMKKIDNYVSSNKTIDLKLIICSNYEFFCKTKNFEVIKKYKNIYYFKGYFYLSINDINDDIISVVEYCTIIDKIEFFNEFNNMIKI